MPEPIADVKPAAPVTAASPAPAQPVQPTPVAQPGASSKPVDAKPQESLVPLPALQEERSKRQALEAEVAELRRMVSQPAPMQQPQHQVDPRAELEQLWESDPKKAVQVEIMYAMDWRDRIDANLEVQADVLSRKYPDFNNYRSVALGQVRSLPLNQRGGNGILEAAYWMVRGQNTDTIIQQREAELLERYRRGEISASGLATPPGSFSTPAPVMGVQLSDEQLRVAEAMGLTAEQYSSAIKAAR